MHVCRIIQDPALHGSLNMAIDEAILRHLDQDPRQLTTLRLYRWRTPTVSLGYAQQPEQAVDLGFCKAHGIIIVRRPTGGRAVLHAEELTYAVISNDLQLFGGSGIHPAYLVVSRILQRALLQIGCPAEISPGNIHRGHWQQKTPAQPGNNLDPATRAEPCFLSTSRFEITAGGRKLVGSAQRRLKRAFLQHGSILIRCDYLTHATALGSQPQILADSFVGLEEYLSMPDIEGALRQALPDCLEAELGQKVSIGELEQEESLAALHYEQMRKHLVQDWAAGGIDTQDGPRP